MLKKLLVVQDYEIVEQVEIVASVNNKVSD